MKNFLVKLYDPANKLIESVEIVAKGKKTACKKAVFKNQIGWGFITIAEEI